MLATWRSLLDEGKLLSLLKSPSERKKLNAAFLEHQKHMQVSPEAFEWALREYRLKNAKESKKTQVLALLISNGLMQIFRAAHLELQKTHT